jgi:hypothetical protein
VVAAGSQEWRMAERQANGRPGHRQRKGSRHTGGLGQGPWQGAVLVPHLMA